MNKRPKLISVVERAKEFSKNVCADGVVLC